MGLNNNNNINSNGKKSDPADYPVKTIKVNICGSLYNEWKIKKSLYKNTPEEGIPVQIEYADTLFTSDDSGNIISKSSPTIVCLHGAPGSHRDYKHLIKHLQQTGHRVIVPNFPSMFAPLESFLEVCS
jgi:pimeloyl-ACP methyl ester carboxylesterase